MRVHIRRRKIRDIPELKAGKVKVGFPAGKTGSDILNIAIWNHYGTRGGASGGGWGGPIPERPFLENAIRSNKQKYIKGMKQGAKSVFLGSTTMAQIMSKLGILAQGDIQSEITNLSDPPNSPVTIALKGSSNPLVDNGNLRGAVTYEVET